MLGHELELKIETFETPFLSKVRRGKYYLPQTFSAFLLEIKIIIHWRFVWLLNFISKSSLITKLLGSSGGSLESSHRVWGMDIGVFGQRFD